MFSVISFIELQPEHTKRILYILRNLILDSAPGIEEKISYKIPFYSYKGQLCYLNPIKRGVDLGFSKGYLMANEDGLLESRDRKQVRSLLISDFRNIDENYIKALLHEAMLINDWKSKI